MTADPRVPGVTPAAGVTVIEEPLPTLVRRPRDLLRLILGIALLAAVLIFASLAVTTASGLERDFIGVATGLPGIVVDIVNALGNLGLLLIPLAVSIDLLIRRRPGQMASALLAAGLGVVVALLLRRLIEIAEPGTLLQALTKQLPSGSRTIALDAALVAVVALVTVAQLAGRSRWQAVSVLVIGSVATTAVLTSRITLVAAAASILLGWIVGLAVRYVRGAPTERPGGHDIARALATAGLPLVRLEQQHQAPNARRRYHALSADGRDVDVVVLDQDQEGAGLVQYLWRSLRVIRPAARPAYLTVRRSLEHEALTTYAAMSSGAPVVPLLAITRVGPYAAAMAFASSDRRTLSELGGGVSDEQLRAAWRAVNRLHTARIAHRSLIGDRVLVDGNEAQVRDFRFGEVAASDFALELDIAELLTTTGALVGVDRAVAAARAVLGHERVALAAPLLQRLSMSASTRRLLRDHKTLLADLRGQVRATIPDDVVIEQAPVQRFSVRTVLSAVGLAIAAYFLVPQISALDLDSIVASADPRWAALALVFSALTYVGAAMSILGFTPERLKVLPTVLAQFATTYFGLFAPTLVGGVAVNTTYLQRSGVYAGMAVTAVGLSQVSAVIASVALILIFGALAGTGPRASFTPSEGVLLAIAVIVGLVLVAISIPAVRRLALARLRPIARRVIPQLLDTLQNPRALLVGFGGNLLMNLGYIAAMVAAIAAFDGSLSIPATALVLLAGTAVGSIVPSPGGIGAIEAALTAGLTAAGLPSGTALSAVLLYRTVTFWIPVPIGWYAQSTLSKRGLLFGPARPRATA